MNIDPQTKTASLDQYGDPTLFHSLKLKRQMVMQDFVLNSGGRYFITQADNGSNGTREPYESTILTRLNPVTKHYDFMTLLDASHGIGFDVQYIKGVPWVYFNWKAPSESGEWFQLLKFRYKPSTQPYTRARLKKECGLTRVPIDNPELLIHFDWKNNWVVAKHYDNAGSDIYTRRKIDEFLAGVDKKYGEVVAPISKGTLQGFTTINNTLYRLMGQGTTDSRQVNGDGFALQSFSWESGQEFSYKQYPTWGADSSGRWPGGKGEPEGLAVMREKNGKASLLAGLVVGFGSDRRWQIYKFKDIGV